MGRVIVCIVAALSMGGCVRARDVQRDLKVTDVHTGWYDAGIVEGSMNKLVPSITLRLENVSKEDIDRVQVNAIFRRVGEDQVWGEHFVPAIGSTGLPAGATGNTLVLRSPRGYTGSQPRLQLLQNKQFVDVKVALFGKHGASNWVKMGEFQIDRQLLTQ